MYFSGINITKMYIYVVSVHSIDVDITYIGNIHLCINISKRFCSGVTEGGRQTGNALLTQNTFRDNIRSMQVQLIYSRSYSIFLTLVVYFVNKLRTFFFSSGLIKVFLDILPQMCLVRICT